MKRASLTSLIVTCVLAAGCGGSSGSDPGGGGGGTTVGVSGGTVSVTGGPSVTIPAGALSANTSITVAASSASAPTGAIGSLYQFGPAGTTFATPVTVSFPVPAGTPDNSVVYWTKPGSTDQWDALPATVSGTTATVQVSHFSSGYVGAPCTAVACSAAEYAPVAVARRYAYSGVSTYTQTDQTLSYTAPSWSRKYVSSNAAGDQVRGFILVSAGVGLASLANHDGNGTQTSALAYSPPMLVFPADTTPGATASSTSTVTGSNTFTISRTLTVNGIEAVTVPGGTFTALKFTISQTQSNAGATTIIAWFAAGVGVVKQVSYPTATPAQSTIQELMAWTPMACSGGPCACNAVVNGGPLVTPMYVASALPVGTGGTIVDGTYYLTANRIFTGAGGGSGPITDYSVRTAYSFHSSLLEVVSWYTGLTADVRVSGRISPTLGLLQTCGPSDFTGDTTSTFTATSSELHFFVDNHCTSMPCDLGAEAVLTRQ